MRKYLGVVAALCAISWAQTPTSSPDPSQTPAQAQGQPPASGQTPAQAPEAPTIPPRAEKPIVPPTPYPRLEVFGGGTYAETGFFNSGHWAGLYGWDASLAGNATRWLGFVVEGGQYFGTSKIPVATPAPFPFPPCQPSCTAPTFGVDTREYNIMFGGQFTRRKWDLWTPFAEVLYGHQGVRGDVTPAIPGPVVMEIGTGKAIEIGAGLDHPISPRLALRLKADYFQTGTAFPAEPKQKQDNFRISLGVVIRRVPKKKRKLEEDTEEP